MNTSNTTAELTAEIQRLRKENRAWENAAEAARTTITYLERRGKEKQKHIRQLETRIKHLEGNQ